VRRSRKGALLFTIEPEPYKVKLDQAKAAEEGARSALKQAQAAFERQAELVGRQAATQANYDQALATRDGSQSTLTQAEVNTRLAALNLEYAHVTAPFDGIVTARQVSVGQFVGSSASPTLLATIIASAVDAARARFRPILMTSFAFILGVAPLVFATGAGASARKSIGITVFSGMLASTCLAVLFVPAFFVVVQRLEEWRAGAGSSRPVVGSVEG
jgi:multidrug efflux pump subunit AcrA (membrane-fusion protein)